MNIRINGSDARAWFSSESPPTAQQGELGYIIDTQQLGIYRNGNWHFWKSDLQLLGEIRDVLVVEPVPAVVYDDENPLITRPARGTTAVAPATFRVEIGVVAATGFAAELIPGTGKKLKVMAFYTSKPSAGVTIRLIKNSTASTGGTSTNSPIVPMDSTYPSTATCKLFTAAPTAGIAVGDVFERVFATTDDVYEEFGLHGVSPVMLRGDGETLAVNVSAAATLVGYLEFTEEPL